MRIFFSKNLKNLVLFKKCEIERIILKIFKKYFLINLKNLMVFKVKNVCFETGNKRSFNTFFFLSRMSIKKNIFYLNGLKKVTW